MRIYAASVAALLVALAGGDALAEPAGKWTRPNGEIAEFYKCDGKLCCKIVQGKSPGFEMCHGMAQTEPNEWRGNGMKHPEMPGFMTFNGTITLAATTLSIRGCAIGELFCDAETWTKAR